MSHIMGNSTVNLWDNESDNGYEYLSHYEDYEDSFVDSENLMEVPMFPRQHFENTAFNKNKWKKKKKRTTALTSDKAGISEAGE